MTDARPRPVDVDAPPKVSDLAKESARHVAALDDLADVLHRNGLPQRATDLRSACRHIRRLTRAVESTPTNDEGSKT